MTDITTQPHEIKKILLRSLEVVVLFLATYFIVHYLQRSWPTVSASLNHLNWPLLFLAWLLFLVYFASRSVAWQLILRGLKINLPLRETCQIWFLSEFSRYIPGNAWSFLGRIHLSGKKGVPSAIALTSMLIEIIFLLGGTAIFLATFLWQWPYPHNANLRWLFILIVPALVILLTPRFIERSIIWLLTKLKRLPIDFKIGRADLAIILSAFTLGWAAYGAASLVVMKSLVGADGIPILWIVSGFVVAWLVGYLSFVTPMGLGVREGVAIAMLTPFLNVGLASLVAIGTRLALIFSELSVLTVIGVVAMNGKWLTHGPVVKKWLYDHWIETALGGSIILFIIVFCGYSFTRQAHFITSLYDIGIMDQVVWNTAHGHIFQQTDVSGTNTVSRFTIHADLFLVLLAPLYWMVSSPYSLLFIQVFVSGLGAIPLFLLAKQVLHSRLWALLIALVYLLNPHMQRAAIFDFHSVTLATTFIIASFYFLFNRRWGWYGLHPDSGTNS